MIGLATTGKGVREATISDLPRLVEIAQETFSENEGFDGPKAISDYLETLILSDRAVVFISSLGFWIGLVLVDPRDPSRSAAAFMPYAVENSFWADAAWSANAWAESIGVLQLRAILPIKASDPMKFYTALGFSGLSVVLARPVGRLSASQRSFKQ